MFGKLKQMYESEKYKDSKIPVDLYAERKIQV